MGNGGFWGRSQIAWFSVGKGWGDQLLTECKEGVKSVSGGGGRRGEGGGVIVRILQSLRWGQGVCYRDTTKFLSLPPLPPSGNK